jgi:group I intron endonuclease
MSDNNKGENNPMFGKNHSDKTKQIMSDAKKGEKNPMYDKPKPVGAGTGKPSQAIEVTDIKNDTTSSYDSMSAAAIALNIDTRTISNYFRQNQKKPYKGQYTFKKI